MTVWGDAAADAALAECRRTCTGPLPCYAPEYLAARQAYHAELVRLGVITHRQALGAGAVHQTG